VVDEEYPHFIAFDWSTGDRAQRITELIEAEIDNDRKISVQDLQAIHFDNKSLLAQSYVPLMQNLSSDDPDVQAAIERLRGWDLHETKDSVPASLFEIFFVHLMSNVLADDIGQENLDLLPGQAKIIFMHQLTEQLDAKWWDNENTTQEETWQDMILLSLSDAVAWLQQDQGGSMNEWAWGQLHTITFEDAILGASGIAPIEAIFNRGPYAVNSGRDLVNAQNWSDADPAAVSSHASQRMLLDLNDFDNSRGIIPTGNSGHPFNDHYDDQMPLYLAGQYHPMPFSREAVEAAAVEYLLLQPQP
jgi:penicillin amidase